MRIALVIGNGAYSSGPLGSPKDDVKAIEVKLKALSFQVTRKIDLGRDEFFDAIRNFGERLQQAGTVGLFYYSGHGMQVNNRNYMIPTDADIRSDLDVGRFAVPVEDVLVRMEVGKSNPNFVILDACRNNPFEKRFKSSQDGLAQMDAPPSTLIAFAAAPGRVAEAGSGGQLSLYTEVLAAHIDKPTRTSSPCSRRCRTRSTSAAGASRAPASNCRPVCRIFRPVVLAIPRSVVERFLVFMDFSKANLTPEGVGILKTAVDAFARSGKKIMLIEGHTDASGDASQNLLLSRGRAESVKDYLSSEFGIPKDAMVAVGYGESRPLVPTPDGDREPQNRRIEIHFGNEQDADMAMQSTRELEGTVPRRVSPPW